MKFIKKVKTSTKSPFKKSSIGLFKKSGKSGKKSVSSLASRIFKF